MNREALWKIYTDKNPHFLERGANLSPEGLKKLFETTWDVAYKSGMDTGMGIAGADVRNNNKIDENIFNQLFGKGFKA